MQCEAARKTLDEGQFDTACTFFAVDASGPAGIVVVRAGEGVGRLELIAVREDVRRCGLAQRLLDLAVVAARAKGLQRLVAAQVHCGNEAGVGLLKAAGFVGRSQGGLRMRRLLDGAWPALAAPDGFMLRALRPGEAEAWVRLKNACFREDGGEDWTREHFQREFVDNPVYDLERILVAVQGNVLAGTTSAWEVDYGAGGVGLIHWVGVDPTYRGRGLGEALMIRALNELVARGYEDAWLSTGRERGAAVRLYERLGFAVERELFMYALEMA